MNKFIPQYEPDIRPEYIEAVSEQMKTGWIGSSKATEDFEDAIKDLTGRQHVISTTSGTMALYLGLVAMEIPKDKVILFPSYTFLAGANVIKSLGYQIEFIDIDEESLCMDPNLLLERIGKNPDDIGTVVYVEHNSNTEWTHTIEMMCMMNGINIVVDSAQSISEPIKCPIRAFSIYSFSVPKLITTGQGGVVLTDNDELAERVKRIRDHGDNWRASKVHEHVGLNLKFNDMAAALGLAQLDQFDDILERRNTVFDNYRKHIKLVDFGYRSTWMVIYKTDHADAIITALKYNDIQAFKYYRPIPTNPAFEDGKNYPVAEYVFDHCIYLPSSLTLTKNDIDRICKIIKRVEENERY